MEIIIKLGKMMEDDNFRSWFKMRLVVKNFDDNLRLLPELIFPI